MATTIKGGLYIIDFKGQDIDQIAYLDDDGHIFRDLEKVYGKSLRIINANNTMNGKNLVLDVSNFYRYSEENFAGTIVFDNDQDATIKSFSISMTDNKTTYYVF